MNLINPLEDEVDFTQAPTNEELLLAAEGEHDNTTVEPTPEPIPDVLANPNHIPNVNPHILTVPPLYSTPISYPMNILPGYIE